MTTESLGIAVLTYNRTAYLRELVESLTRQTDGEFKLAILDNGSDDNPLDAIQDFLPLFRYEPVLEKIESNVFSVTRVRDVVSLLDTSFVVLPGDDDVALPNYVSVLRGLIRSSGDTCAVSAAAQVIDEHGHLSSDVLQPSAFSNKVEALSTLLCGNAYALPSTAFRRDLLFDPGLPQTMTALDWWLWIRAWIEGTVVVTSEPILQYRQHSQQQQHWYGRPHFALDGTRMLLAIFDRKDFHDVVKAMNLHEHDEFVSRILANTRGLNIGNGSWSPLLEVRLADVLADLLSDQQIQALHAQGSVELGAIPNMATLRALSGTASVAGIPPNAWKRIPLQVLVSRSTCAHVASWLQFLGLTDRNATGAASLTFACSCVDQASVSEVSVRVQMQCSLYPETEFSLRLAAEPSDAASSELRFLLGETLNALGATSHMPRILRRAEIFRRRWGTNPMVKGLLRLMRR